MKFAPCFALRVAALAFVPVCGVFAAPAAVTVTSPWYAPPARPAGLIVSVTSVGAAPFGGFSESHAASSTSSAG